MNATKPPSPKARGLIVLLVLAVTFLVVVAVIESQHQPHIDCHVVACVP